MNVRVYREDASAQREHQCAGRSFTADSLECHYVFNGLGIGSILDPFEVEIALSAIYLI